MKKLFRVAGVILFFGHAVVAQSHARMEAADLAITTETIIIDDQGEAGTALLDRLLQIGDLEGPRIYFRAQNLIIKKEGAGAYFKSSIVFPERQRDCRAFLETPNSQVWEAGCSEEDQVRPCPNAKSVVPGYFIRHNISPLLFTYLTPRSAIIGQGYFRLSRGSTTVVSSGAEYSIEEYARPLETIYVIKTAKNVYAIVKRKATIGDLENTLLDLYRRNLQASGKVTEKDIEEHVSKYRLSAEFSDLLEDAKQMRAIGDKRPTMTIEFFRNTLPAIPEIFLKAVRETSE